MLIPIISGLLGLLVGLIFGYFIRVWHREKSIKATRELAEKIVEDGKKEAEKAKRESVLEAKQEIFVLRKDFDNDMRERRQVVVNLENKVSRYDRQQERRKKLILEGAQAYQPPPCNIGRFPRWNGSLLLFH